MANKPMAGDVMYNALRDKDCIIMAANTRFIPGVAEGIFRAAKDLDAPMIRVEYQDLTTRTLGDVDRIAQFARQ